MQSKNFWRNSFAVTFVVAFLLTIVNPAQAASITIDWGACNPMSAHGISSDRWGVYPIDTSHCGGTFGSVYYTSTVETISLADGDYEVGGRCVNFNMTYFSVVDGTLVDDTPGDLWTVNGSTLECTGASGEITMDWNSVDPAAAGGVGGWWGVYPIGINSKDDNGTRYEHDPPGSPVTVVTDTFLEGNYRIAGRLTGTTAFVTKFSIDGSGTLVDDLPDDGWDVAGNTITFNPLVIIDWDACNPMAAHGISSERWGVYPIDTSHCGDAPFFTSTFESLSLADGSYEIGGRCTNFNMTFFSIADGSLIDDSPGDLWVANGNTLQCTGQSSEITMDWGSLDPASAGGVGGWWGAYPIGINSNDDNGPRYEHDPPGSPVTVVTDTFLEGNYRITGRLSGSTDFVTKFSIDGSGTLVDDVPDDCWVVSGTTITYVGDDDGDGACNPDDNCPDTHNPGQEDCDGDNVGDACDTTSGSCLCSDLATQVLDEACNQFSAVPTSLPEFYLLVDTIVAATLDACTCIDPADPGGGSKEACETHIRSLIP